MNNKSRKQRVGSVRSAVEKEMLEPRMARSAKIAERNLATERVSEEPSITVPGTVAKIVPPTTKRKLEKAQISVKGSQRPYRNIRIDNTLTDEDGGDVKLKKGARVDVTVAAKPKT